MNEPCPSNTECTLKAVEPCPYCEAMAQLPPLQYFVLPARLVEGDSCFYGLAQFDAEQFARQLGVASSAGWR